LGEQTEANGDKLIRLRTDQGWEYSYLLSAERYARMFGQQDLFGHEGGEDHA